MSARPENSALASSPAHLLHRAQRFADQHFARAAGHNAPSHRQYVIMCALDEGEGRSQSALARATGIDRSTLAEMVARMQRAGLVMRRASRRDGRVKEVSLSEKGAALYADLQAAAQATDAAIFAALSKKQRLQIMKILNRLLA